MYLGLGAAPAGADAVAGGDDADDRCPGFSIRPTRSTRRTSAARRARSRARRAAGCPSRHGSSFPTRCTAGLPIHATRRDAERRVCGRAIDAALARRSAPTACRSPCARRHATRTAREHSFAGQLESFLNVARRRRSRLACVDVWRSAFSDRVAAYRRERGLPASPRPPAVILQRMVAPRAAGVAFSADPVSGRRGVAVVERGARAGRGARVRGSRCATPGTSTATATIVERPLDDVADDGDPVLTDEQVRDVAGAGARTAARLFGWPQDIEWAIGDRLVLLQSRPITSLRSTADPDGAPRHLGQQQHRRKLQRRHDAADVFVRARDLSARLPAVLPDDGRAAARDRAARRHVSRTCSGWSAAASTTTCSTGIASWRCFRATASTAGSWNR